MIFGDTYDPSGAAPINAGSSYPIVVSATAPTDPNKGLAWLNSATGVVSVWDGAKWVLVSGAGGGATVGGVTVGAVAPAAPSRGDLWLDTNSNELKTYDGVSWLQQLHDGGRY